MFKVLGVFYNHQRVSSPQRCQICGVNPLAACDHDPSLTLALFDMIENINQQASFAYARPADQSNHSHCLISQHLAKTLPFAAASYNLPAVVKLGLIRSKGSEEVIWV